MSHHTHTHTDTGMHALTRIYTHTLNHSLAILQNLLRSLFSQISPRRGPSSPREDEKIAISISRTDAVVCEFAGTQNARRPDQMRTDERALRFHERLIVECGVVCFGTAAVPRLSRGRQRWSEDRRWGSSA